MKNRINEIEELMEQILKEKSAPMLKKLLDKSVIFRNFSPRNSILITMQCPEATTVMGRKAWERYGMKPRNDYIVITGIKREIRGDEEKKEQWLKRNPFRQITDGILPERLRSLQKGNKPTKEELEFASSIIPDFDKMYDNWIKSKPKEIRFTNLYIPVKVYDISQCEIVDEEKFKNLPRPKMDIKFPDKLPIEEILEEKGFAIDGSTPVSIGKAVGKVVLIDGQAEEQERTFQLAQAWASTKVKEPHEAVMAATMLMLHTGLSEAVPDSVLEIIFLKVRTPKELSAAISKAGKAFREMAEELEVAIEKEMRKEEDVSEIDLEFY
jgi:hypothetical protein